MAPPVSAGIQREVDILPHLPIPAERRSKENAKKDI
jgi:hypothetical protein